MEGTVVATCTGQASTTSCQTTQIAGVLRSETSFDFPHSGGSQRLYCPPTTGIHHPTLALLTPPRISCEGGLDAWRTQRQLFGRELDSASDAKALFVQTSLGLVDESEVEAIASDVLLIEAMASIGWDRFALRLDARNAGMGYHSLCRVFPVQSLAQWVAFLVDNASLSETVAEHLATFNFNSCDWEAFVNALSGWGEATYSKCFDGLEKSDIVDLLSPQFDSRAGASEIAFCNEFVACYFLDAFDNVRESVASEIRLRMSILQANFLPLYLPNDILNDAYYLDDVFSEVQDVIDGFTSNGIERSDYKRTIKEVLGQRSVHYFSDWEEFEGYLDLYEQRRLIIEMWTCLTPLQCCEREPYTAKELSILDWCDRCDSALLKFQSPGHGAVRGNPIPLFFPESLSLESLVDELYNSIMDSSDDHVTTSVFPALAPNEAENLISRYGTGVRLLAELSALSL